MNNLESGNAPQKRMDRWSTPKKYPCAHKDCDKAATVLRSAGCFAHNCCTEHEELTEMKSFPYPLPLGGEDQ